MVLIVSPTRGSTCELFELVFEGTWCPDPGTRWLVLWCGGVRGPLEPLESFWSPELPQSTRGSKVSFKDYMLAQKEHRETIVNGICCCAVASVPVGFM